MGRKAAADESDRFLTLRAGRWHYRRKVPASVGDLDARAPMVRISLKTGDLAEARRKRDVLEAADNELWAALLVGGGVDAARRRYRAAVLRAEAHGFAYRPIEALEGAPLEALVERFRATERQPAQVEQAIVGLASAPAVTVSKAFEIYCDEIMPAQLAGKSESQRAMWKKVKKRAIENFKLVVGDRPIGAITRDEALRFYQHWMARVAPKAGPATASASAGNRDVGNMRALFREYHAYIGERDRANPFEGLAFAGRKVSRPPFSEDWIRTRLLAPANIRKLNREARAIFLMVLAMGARPSEIANLLPADIVLDAPVPHIHIRRQDDPAQRREIKTDASERQVPLVGLALAVMTRHPNGFPRYRNKEENLSAVLNQWLEVNKLQPTPRHKPYSARHSFEDRMKVAGLDEELRRILMGHSIARPRYGAGGTLEWRAAELAKATLPFDPSILG